MQASQNTITDPQVKTGRPPKWSDPDKLEAAIQDYFETCDKGRYTEELTKRGELVKYNKRIPYTMEGIADHLGISRETLKEYGKTDLFSGIVSRARTRIYRQWSENGLDNTYNAKIAALCLAAHVPDYRVNSDSNVNIQIGLEDRLRTLLETRKQGAAPRIEHNPDDVQDIEPDR